MSTVFGLHPDRNVPLSQANRLGRAEWKQPVRYHQRLRVESDFGLPRPAPPIAGGPRSLEGAKAELLAAAGVEPLAGRGGRAGGHLPDTRCWPVAGCVSVAG